MFSDAKIKFKTKLLLNITKINWINLNFPDLDP